MTKISTLLPQSRKQILKMMERLRLGLARKLPRHQESQAGPPLPPPLLEETLRLPQAEAVTRKAVVVVVVMGEGRVRNI